RRFGVGSVLIGNLLVFFVIPYKNPPANMTLAPRNRTTTQRVASLTGRAFSVYLPSYQRIVRHDEEVKEALQLIREETGADIEKTITVIDPAAAQFVDGRLMQVYLPEYHLTRPSLHSVEIMGIYHGIEGIE